MISARLFSPKQTLTNSLPVATFGQERTPRVSILRTENGSTRELLLQAGLAEAFLNG